MSTDTPQPPESADVAPARQKPGPKPKPPATTLLVVLPEPLKAKLLAYAEQHSLTPDEVVRQVLVSVLP